MRQKATRVTLPALPVMQVSGRLRAALAAGHALLTADPGSGKTTLVPLLLIDEPWLAGRKIVMLEPRRPAARMAARRMAALLGEAVGETVGYQVRFERKVSPRTRVEVLTEGLLIRRLQADPELQDVGLLILDEFHERNLYSDLALALCLDVVDSLRGDLRLLVMSATLDTGPLQTLLDAPVISASGRPHDVELVYAGQAGDARDPVPACIAALTTALARRRGDVLVFLPGRREIERMQAALQGHVDDGTEIMPLYGDLPGEAQDRALRPGQPGRRRIILSTDIAESSLTIEGVEVVVDSGLARRPAFDPRSGLTRLQTVWISKASAAQRSGRAGRLGPGICVRAYEPTRFDRLADWSPAEITTADLAPTVLELAAWGVSDPAELRWVEMPPRAHWDQARGLLQRLGAIDAAGRVLATGREMARLPVHPRLAHMLLAAQPADHRELAADIAALLSERDPLGGRTTGADVEQRLAALRDWRGGHRATGRDYRHGLQRTDRAARQFRRLIPQVPTPVDPVQETVAPGALLALAYPDRLARASGGQGLRYLLRAGRAAILDADDPLRGTPWLVIGSLDGGRREGRIWLAAELAERDVERLFGNEITRRREVRWDAGRGDVVARVVRRLDAIVLAEDPSPLRAGDRTVDVLLAQLREQGLAAFFDDPVQLRRRVALMRDIEPGGEWPDLGAAALLSGLDDWLVPWLRDGEGIAQLRRLDLDGMLRAMLGWEKTARLDCELPDSYRTPAGSQRRIHYPERGQPYLDVPLQEMLGESRGPLLAGGRVPLVLQLLSPAGRPLHKTADLAAFWAGSYDAVRKEMRGRYPKHYWPDDPLNAKPTRFTKRRMEQG